jgi:predicted nuclease of predicted toxin-antitoxin system
VKLLIDNCVSVKIAPALIAEGHDVECVGNWPSDPGDPRVLQAAHAAGRVLVTGDRGFGQLAVRYGLRNSGIIVLRTLATEHVESVLRAIAEHHDNLLAGAVVIVTSERMRARSRDPDA